MNNFWIIAEADQDAQPEVIKAEDIDAATEQSQQTIQPSDSNTPPVEERKPSPYTQFIFIGLIFVMLYFVMFRGPKKKQQEQKKMINSLQKNDRIQTVGGILGTVIDVGENEVTIKIDESNNTKMRVVPSAVARVI